MEKYRILRRELCAQGILRPDELHPSKRVSLPDLQRVHTPEYVRATHTGDLSQQAKRDLGLPWSPALVDRSRASVFGTLAAAQAALSFGIAGNLAGGTHHAFADRGEGFCMYNDIAVAAQTLLDAGDISRALVLDLDVHQGNGTAAIFAGDTRVFTCSIHGTNNYPYQKPPSDLDIGLPDNTNDAAYLEVLRRVLPQILQQFHPDILFYQAGVDALAQDRLGRLSLTHQGLRQRDQTVLSLAQSRELPTVLTLGGGYANPITASIQASISTYDIAKQLYP